MYGDHLQLFQLMEIVIMFRSLMFSLDIHGFSLFKQNLMSCPLFFNFKSWLNVYLIIKLLVFNLTRVVSIVIFIYIFNLLVLLIVSLVPIHINNKDVLNVNTDILSTPLWHCSLTVIFPKNIRMKLVLHHATSLIACQLPCYKINLPLKNFSIQHPTILS